MSEMELDQGMYRHANQMDQRATESLLQPPG